MELVRYYIKPLLHTLMVAGTDSLLLSRCWYHSDRSRRDGVITPRLQGVLTF